MIATGHWAMPGHWVAERLVVGSRVWCDKDFGTITIAGKWRVQVEWSTRPNRRNAPMLDKDIFALWIPEPDAHVENGEGI